MSELSAKFGRVAILCGAVAIGTIGGTGWAGGDAATGEAVYKAKCAACHGIEAGKHKMGPSMAGIMGMKAGSTDFTRYVGLKGADYAWDAENMDSFLADPKTFLGGRTSMPIPLPDADDRKNVIAYLQTLK